MSIEVRVPTLGESVTEATIATWFKKPGDTVSVDEMLCELETDKVTVEVPSPAAGTLGEIVAGEGSTVGVNALLATISEGAGAAPAPKAEKTAPPADAAVTQTEAGPETPAPRKDVEDAPSAKKAMAEAGLTRDDVTGTGRDGRVMKEDVARAASAPAPAAKAPDPAPTPIPRAPWRPRMPPARNG
jgi:2-oxoglutarate dehydrogenase E2 component (dihydrolipoamide succinyltransferase)